MSSSHVLILLAALYPSEVEKSEYLTPKEVERVASSALVDVLAYIADSDRELKAALKKLDESAEKVKRLEKGDDAPKSLAKAKKDHQAAKAVVLDRQVKLIEGLAVPSGYDAAEFVKRPKAYSFVFRGKTKEEAAKLDASHASYLLQYVDKDYRAALKALRGLSESKARTERSLKDISDVTEKVAAEKRLKDFQAKFTESNKAAAQKRNVLLRRLVEEIGDVWTLKLLKTYP